MEAKLDAYTSSSSLLLSFFFSLVASFILILHFYKISWKGPRKIEKALKDQGIDGPPPSLFNGNLKEMRSLTLQARKSASQHGGHQSLTQDYAKTLFPYLHQWKKNYGSIFMFWIGRRPVVFVSQPDLVGEISRRVSFDIGKATHLQKIQKPLFGGGIIKSNGAKWAHQRKTIAPEFFLNKVKGMVELMVESAMPLLESWESRVEHECGAVEIEVYEDFRSFSQDVISRACFGGSCSKGKEIFAKLMALSRLISEKRNFFEFPSFRPEKLRRALRKQGITGPKPTFLLGNIPDMKRTGKEGAPRREQSNEIVHDYHSSLFPYFGQWRETYGPIFMFSVGSSVGLYVTDPDILKEICLNKSLDIGKTTFSNKSFNALFGKGIIAASGHAWAIQRKIIAPEFFMDKVKDMVDLMAESALPLLKSWEEKVEQRGGTVDIKIDEDFHSYAADVLSRACFSSNYAAGKDIFSKITSLQVALPMQSMLAKLPGSMYLPTKSNRVIWKLAKEISSLVKKVVRERTKSEKEEKDLLQSILKNSMEEDVEESFIVDNCKNIYFAGQETTATAAKWVLVLLASNPRWQMRIHEEVIGVCGGHKPDIEKLKKLPLLTQVIQETLRLYPASPIFARQLYGDMRFGDLHLTKGTSLWIPILYFHYDFKLWGPDANQFKPERFARGVSGACKHPHLYMPFGFGPRTCLGQNFAMVQLKTVLALILSRYKVSPSPKHRHSVDLRLILGPKHGVHIVIEKV